MTTSAKQGCYCGCGKTPVGPNSKFIPGHDAILKSLLTDVREGRLPGRVIPQVLLDAARADREGETCTFQHEDILRLCGKVI